MDKDRIQGKIKQVEGKIQEKKGELLICRGSGVRGLPS